MKLNRRSLAGALLIALLVSLIAAPGGAATSGADAGPGNRTLPAGWLPAVRPNADTVAIRPAAKTVQAGQAFSLEVKIEGDTAVVASDVQILFNTTYLECLSVVHSGIFDSYFIDHSNLAGGVIWFGGGTQGTRPPPFTFVTLNFRARSVLGATELTFNPAETDVQGVNGSVLGGLINGVVTIVAAPTATATPTVTQTPTVTPTPTVTQTPTITPTPSRTPTATASATPTSTPTPRPGELCVLAFEDLNGDLVRDAGERLLAGAEIAVRDAGMAVLHRISTDGVTEPRCLTLPPAVYYVDEIDPPGYGSAGPNWWGVTLASGTSVTIAFADRASSGTATPTPSRTATATVTSTPSRMATATATAATTATVTAAVTDVVTATAATATPTATSTETQTPPNTPTRRPTPTGSATRVSAMYLPLIMRGD